MRSGRPEPLRQYTRADFVWVRREPRILPSHERGRGSQAERLFRAAPSLPPCVRRFPRGRSPPSHGVMGLGPAEAVQVLRDAEFGCRRQPGLDRESCPFRRGTSASERNPGNLPFSIGIWTIPVRRQILRREFAWCHQSIVALRQHLDFVVRLLEREERNHSVTHELRRHGKTD